MTKKLIDDMDRQQLESALCTREVKELLSDPGSLESSLESIVLYGHRGLDSYGDEELVRQYKEYKDLKPLKTQSAPFQFSPADLDALRKQVGEHPLLLSTGEPISGSSHAPRRSIEALVGRDYRKLLEEGYAAGIRFDSAYTSRLEYLSSEIFEFTTYDSEIDELFAGKALEVCEALNTSKTFDYIKDPENYKWYLLMINMPFFSERTCWGTSVRGAWWEPESPRSDFFSGGLWDNGEQVLDVMVFDRDTWAAFITAVLEFSRVQEVTVTGAVDPANNGVFDVEE